MTPNKVQPALLGGVFIGVMSALPLINIGNCVCCMWVVAGGVLAAYLLQQNHPLPITMGDGAVTGLLAGVIGAVVTAALSIPLNMILGPMQRRMMERMMESTQDFPSEMRGMVESMSGGAASIVISFVFMLLAGMVFATLGGVIGAAIFRRHTPPAATIEVPPPL